MMIKEKIKVDLWREYLRFQERGGIPSGKLCVKSRSPCFEAGKSVDKMCLHEEKGTKVCTECYRRDETPVF